MNIEGIAYENLEKITETILQTDPKKLTRKITNDYKRNFNNFIKVTDSRNAFEKFKEHYLKTSRTLLSKYRPDYECCLHMFVPKSVELKNILSIEYLEFILREQDMTTVHAKFNRLLARLDEFVSVVFTFKYLIDVHKNLLATKTYILVQKMFTFILHWIDIEKELRKINEYFKQVMIFLSFPDYAVYCRPILDSISLKEKQLIEAREVIIRSAFKRALANPLDDSMFKTRPVQSFQSSEVNSVQKQTEPEQVLKEKQNEGTSRVARIDLEVQSFQETGVESFQFQPDQPIKFKSVQSSNAESVQSSNAESVRNQQDQFLQEQIQQIPQEQTVPKQIDVNNEIQFEPPLDDPDFMIFTEFEI